MNFSLLIWQHQICNELDADSKKKKKSLKSPLSL